MAEVAITFGASMVTAILQPMAEKAGKELYGYFDKMVNIKTEIKNLQSTLHIIQGVIKDAEEKQIENKDIRVWLRQLVDIGYEARDVLDDFFTYCSLERDKKASKSVNSKFLLSLFKSGSSSSTIPFKIRSRLATDIKSVNKKLDELTRQCDIFSNLKSVVGTSGSETVPIRQRPETGPFQDKQRDVFVGRDAVKEDILRKVLNHSHNSVDIIPIWGMGGIGKTTLAQSIFNDPGVTEGDMYPSKNRVWHCVGEKKLDAKEIIKGFAHGLNPTSSAAEIQKTLVEKFNGDKFLIVLDDVWDVDRSGWELLWNPLTNVGKGGVIIITTRDKNCITTVTESPVPDPIAPLSYDNCWLIFKSHAYNSIDQDNDMDRKKLEIGQEIVRKLKGLPLAAKVVGSSLLRAPDVRTWMKFLHSPLRKLNEKEDDVMPVLRWSYNRLSSHLKQCFSYCALFPKDHVFDKKELVKMWMAHDIIPKEAKGEKQPEDIGDEYFKELVNASFFQFINGKYLMHDTIRDLALLVSGEDFITLSHEHSSSRQTDNIRHISIIQNDDYLKNLCLCKSKRILTVYTVCNWYKPVSTHLGKYFLDPVLKQWKSIRVLVLSDNSITALPDCINELKHLRYLDVSKIELVSLPDSLFELYNLQTLVAPYHVNLSNKNVGNLKNLRHLIGPILPTCKVIAQLTSLQDISAVRVCKGDCISEWRHLRVLHGTLEISGLQNFISSEDAAQAMMQDKEFIDRLKLRFMGDEEHAVSSKEYRISENVLQALNCPPNLKYLDISDFNGDRFPSWLTNVANSMRLLSFLTIERCKVVKLLQLDAFVSLKHLNVRHCSNLQCVRLAKEVAATIEFLSLRDCHELRKIESESLLSLRDLWIIRCNKVISFSPCLVKIQNLRVIGGNLSYLRFTVHGIKSLESLQISECPMLKQFFIVEEGSTSLSSSSASLLLSLPDDEDVSLLTHKFEHNAEGRLVLNRRWSSITELPLPNDEDISSSTHKFVYDAEGKLVLNIRRKVKGISN